MKATQHNHIAPTHSSQSPFFKKGSNKSFFNSVPVSVQAKLTVNEPGDIYEKEADAMADKVVQRMADKSFSGDENNRGHFFNKPKSFVQRKCAACDQEEKLQKKDEGPEEDELQGKIQRKPIFESNAEQPDENNIQKKCSSCEKEEKLHKKASPSSSSNEPGDIESTLNTTGGSGNPMPVALRRQMESSFSSDFSSVKIHNDSTSVQMNESLNAQAFTHGSDIYFNSGKYNSDSTSGKHLLAHELTHVVQQNGKRDIQKQDEEIPGSSTDSSNQGMFLVDDSAAPSQGQMNKTSFLQRLNAEVCQTVDDAVRFTGSSSDNCPYIREVFARYQNNSPAQIEAVIQRYEPATRFAQSADDIIRMVKAHAFTAAVQWAANGLLPGLPENISNQISSGIATVSNAVSTVTNAVSSVTSSISNAVSSVGNLFFKAKPGTTPGTQSPLGVMNSLGKGSSINSGTRNKMESTFGTSFSDVQVHTDSKASGLSSGMNARAFTVGNHIAFGSGEYKPGTMLGDALMAHELAHVIQQKGNPSSNVSAGNYSMNSQIEKEADNSTFGFLANQALRGDQKKSLRPKLKSGLSIHSCGKKSVPHTPCTTTETASINSYRTRGSGWVDTALVKLRERPVRADVLASLQRNFGAANGTEANLPGIIEKIVGAQTQMNGSAYYCAGAEDSTCAANHCGYTYAGNNEFLICRNVTLASTNPDFQSYCPIHESYHAAFSSFDVDSYSGWNNVWKRSSDYPGSDTLHNADSYTTVIYDLK